MFCLITTNGFDEKNQFVWWEHGVVCVTLLLSPADQFPGLQSKMRVVLRVEVEAVKFLKEEPHRLDALLKRCKTITDTLATMRKYESAPTEGLLMLPLCLKVDMSFSKRYFRASFFVFMLNNTITRGRCSGSNWSGEVLNSSFATVT